MSEITARPLARARIVVGTALSLLVVLCWFGRDDRISLPVAALEPYAVAAVVLGVVWVVVVDFRWHEIDHEVAVPAWALTLVWSDEPLVLAGLSTTVGAVVAAAAWRPDHPRYRYDPFAVAVPAIVLTWLAVDTVAALVAAGGIAAVLAWRYFTRLGAAAIGMGDVAVVMLGAALWGWPPPSIMKLPVSPVVPLVLLVLVNLWLVGKVKSIRIPAAPVILPPFATVFVLQFAGVLS